MQGTTIHRVLCHAPGAEAARAHAERFFEATMLLNYDRLDISADLSLRADDDGFWPALEAAEAKNRAVLKGYLDELRAAGCEDFDDILHLGMGYASKLVHLTAHLVDGFIGIDSAFYNLPEDSHWISRHLARRVRRCPDEYWLLHVTGVFGSVETASLVHS